jgi:hypothetical protein
MIDLPFSGEFEKFPARALKASGIYAFFRDVKQ